MWLWALIRPGIATIPKASITSSARELWELILKLRDEGKTIVLTTHYMEEAERLCDRVAMFHQGRFEGSVPLSNFLSDNCVIHLYNLYTVERVRLLKIKERKYKGYKGEAVEQTL